MAMPVNDTEEVRDSATQAASPLAVSQPAVVEGVLPSVAAQGVGDAQVSPGDAAPGKSTSTDVASIQNGTSSEPETAAKEDRPELSLFGKTLKEAEPASDADSKSINAESGARLIEPIAYEYNLPETLALNDTQKSELAAALDAFRADPGKSVQGLIDIAAKSMSDYADSLAREQVRVWNQTRQEWREQVLSDPLIGGSGHQAAMASIARMRDYFVADKDWQDFNDMIEVTGAGDHPQFLKLLYNVARYFDEPSVPAANFSPPPDIGRAPVRGMRALYKKTS